MTGRHRPVRIDTAPVVEMTLGAVIVLAIVIGLGGTVVPDAGADTVAPTSSETDCETGAGR